MIRSLFIAFSLVFLQKVLASTALSGRDPPPPPAPPGWTYFICLEDNRSFPNFNVPLLEGAYYADPDAMTIESCIAFCEHQPVSYRFAAVTDGFQCSCDNFFEHIFESTEGCDAPCRGDPSEAGGCGGQYVASAYTKNNVTFIIPSVVPSVGQWESLGCYNDSTSARALEVLVDAGNTTVESCVAACQAQGYSLAGAEFGRECWCGSELQHGSIFVRDLEFIYLGMVRQDPSALYCNMGCQGNASETCGGLALLNLYNFTGTYPPGASVVPSVTLGTWTSKGCYSDSVASRTLELRVDLSTVTVEACIKECLIQSFTIAGLEYAQECWCGNEISSPGAPISQSACSQSCVGNDTEVCGGPNALQVYQAN